MSPEQKKNILDQAIDLFSNRDEKAAAEAAKQKAAAEANAKAAAEANAKAVAAANADAAANKAAAETQAKLKELEAKVAAEELAKANEARNEEIRKAMEAQKAAEILATHTVVAGETLSDIAMKYYKSSVREKWMKIYEANKAVIGENPGMIKAGQVLKIPKA
jgi:nucleoid-associated protein YgaU